MAWGDDTPEEVAYEKEWYRQYYDSEDSMNVMALVAAGIIGTLFIRNVALSLERLLVGRAERKRVAAGSPSPRAAPAVQPFLARQLGKVERHLLKPVNLPFIPKEYTWINLGMYVFILAANVAANLAVDMAPKNARVTRLETFAIRTGCTATFQFPLLYAFAGRNNLIGWLTGIEYQTLRSYHKLLGAICFVETLLHTFAYLAFWAKEYGWEQWKESWYYPYPYIVMGAVATIAMFVCILFALPPIRSRAYEFFLISHFIGAIVCLIGAWYHWEFVMYNWVYAACAIWFAQYAYRLRALVLTRWSHLRLRAPIVQADATVVHGAILLRVPFTEGGWTAGQHFFLSFWGSALLRKPWLFGQVHPFTVANSSGPGVTHVEFVIRVHGGLTSTLAKLIIKQGAAGLKLPVGLEGPYASRPRFEEFDRVLLVAGGSGITFVSSVLSEIVQAGRIGSATKVVDFVWSVHHLDQVQWLGDALSKARAFATESGLQLSISIHVTRDATYPDSDKASATSTFSTGPATPAVGLELEKEKALGFAPPDNHATQANLGGGQVHYCRPDVSAIVTGFGEGKGRSLVLACGPESLGDAVRVAAARTAKAGDEWHVASFSG